MVRAGGQVGVFGGGQDGAVTEDFLHFEQVDARFDQMSCITVTQAVRGNLFCNGSQGTEGGHPRSRTIAVET